MISRAQDTNTWWFHSNPECANKTLTTPGKHWLLLHFPQNTVYYALWHGPLCQALFLTSSRYVDIYIPPPDLLTDSWLPHVHVTAVYLLFISPLSGQGCEEHAIICIYLPHPHVHPSPHVPRSGTRRSLALSLPSDCRLTARVKAGWKSPQG